MRIAQASHNKLKKLHSEKKQVQFSHLSSHPILDPTLTGIAAASQRVENILIIYRMKSFKLKENNTSDYNRRALQEYIVISQIYNNLLEQIKYDKTLKYFDVLKQQSAVYSKLFK